VKFSLRNLFFFSFFLFHFFTFFSRETVTLPNSIEPLRLYSLEQGDVLQEVVLKVINEAKYSLDIATYTLSDTKVIKAIKEASDRGVEVVIAVDKKGYDGKREQLGEKTKLVQRAIKGLMHQKWIIQDKKLSLIGSANLTWDSLHNQNNLFVAITSDKFAKQLLSEAEKKKIDHVHPIGCCWATDIPPFTLVSWTTPKNPALKAALLEAIDNAKSTIKIALFTFTEKELLEKLVDAKKRGVHVAVALDKGQSLGASNKTLLRLMKEAIPVGLSVGKPLLHHKFVWIDQEKFFTGSFNWTNAALTQNEELLTLFEGGHKSDPFWKALETTWMELESHVEWQKDENRTNRIWENGASAFESSARKGTHPFSNHLPLAA